MEEPGLTGRLKRWKLLTTGTSFGQISQRRPAPPCGSFYITSAPWSLDISPHLLWFNRDVTLHPHGLLGISHHESLGLAHRYFLDDSSQHPGLSLEHPIVTTCMLCGQEETSKFLTLHLNPLAGFSTPLFSIYQVIIT